MPYKNAEDRRAAQARYQSRKRQKLRDWVNELKSVPCTDCGDTYPPYVMDFDHVKGEKRDNINVLLRQGWAKRLREEVKLCEVVCSNCHRERTWQRTNLDIDR